MAMDHTIFPSLLIPGVTYHFNGGATEYEFKELSQGGVYIFDVVHDAEKPHPLIGSPDTVMFMDMSDIAITRVGYTPSKVSHAYQQMGINLEQENKPIKVF